MSARDVIAEAVRRGIKLYPLSNGKIWLQPFDRADTELINRIRTHKSQLLALLRQSAAKRPPKSHRPFSERELVILAEVEAENDPLILEALRMFNATVAGIEPPDTFTRENLNGHCCSGSR